MILCEYCDRSNCLAFFVFADMGKKGKQKEPKGRAAQKKKAKKGGNSSGGAGWAANFVRDSDMTKQILDDDNGRAILLSVAPSSLAKTCDR